MTNTAVAPWFGAQADHAWSSIDRVRVAETLVRDFAGVSMGGYPVSVAPVVVPERSYRELLTATTRLLELQRQVVLNLAPTPASRMAAMKVDPADHPRVIDDVVFEDRYCAQMARADVLISADGPKFLEFNVGASFGGMVQFDLQRRAWQRLTEGLTGGPVLRSADPFRLYAGLIKEICADLGTVPAALLVGSLEDPSSSNRYFDIQVERLREYGVAARFAPLDRLADDLGDAGALSQGLGLVQFCENEAQSCGWDMSAVLTAAEGGMRLFPSQTTRLVDSKKVLALLSEGQPWMTDEDHELVRRYVPWSRIVADRAVDWRGRRYELPRLLVERQESFVIKGAAGFSSEEVFFGSGTRREQWADLVEAAVASEYYIAQEVVDAVRHPIPVMLDDSPTVETVLAHSVISPFAIGGAAAGCLVRFDRKTEPGAITVRSGARLACLFGAGDARA